MGELPFSMNPLPALRPPSRHPTVCRTRKPSVEGNGNSSAPRPTRSPAKLLSRGSPVENRPKPHKTNERYFFKNWGLINRTCHTCISSQKRPAANARQPAGVFHCTTNIRQRRKRSWEHRKSLGSQALTIPSRGPRRSRAFPVASPVSVIPAPYSLAHFHRFSSLLHSFTSSSLFFTSSLIHFFTAFFTSSTVFRDPNHGERKFPHFWGAIASIQST